jgi:DNA-binding transcriptional LysR family regulator
MLPQLAVFEASARLGSFTRAAEELHLAQPTVSTQMKKLTETVGLPLFEQIGKKMHLTPMGGRSRRHARTVFERPGAWISRSLKLARPTPAAAPRGRRREHFCRKCSLRLPRAIQRRGSSRS